MLLACGGSQLDTQLLPCCRCMCTTHRSCGSAAPLPPPQCTHLVKYGCMACDQDGKCKRCGPGWDEDSLGRVLRNGVCVPVSQLWPVEATRYPC